MERLTYCPAQIDVVTIGVEDRERRQSYELVVPGRTQEEGFSFLSTVGAGSLGSGFRQTAAGLSIPPIRQAYQKRLAHLEATIAERRVSLGDRLRNPDAMKEFAKWAAGQRTAHARIWRLPAGPGGVIGGEIRDWRTYGVGGRTFSHLELRKARDGLRGPDAWNAIASSAVKPNAGETTRILRAARYLRYGGPVMIVLGGGFTAAEIALAPPEHRGEIAERAAVGWLGGMIATDLAIGIAFLGFGVAGLPLLAIVLVAGIAGSFVAERIYYGSRTDTLMHGIEQRGFVHVGELSGSCPSVF